MLFLLSFLLLIGSAFAQVSPAFVNEVTAANAGSFTGLLYDAAALRVAFNQTLNGAATGSNAAAVLTWRFSGTPAAGPLSGTAIPALGIAGVQIQVYQSSISTGVVANNGVLGGQTICPSAALLGTATPPILAQQNIPIAQPSTTMAQLNTNLPRTIGQITGLGAGVDYILTTRLYDNNGLLGDRQCFYGRTRPFLPVTPSSVVVNGTLVGTGINATATFTISWTSSRNTIAPATVYNNPNGFLLSILQGTTNTARLRVRVFPTLTSPGLTSTTNAAGVTTWTTTVTGLRTNRPYGFRVAAISGLNQWASDLGLFTITAGTQLTPRTRWGFTASSSNPRRPEFLTVLNA